MKLHYIKANPSGNTTVFILDPVPKEQYAQVSKAVLSYENVGAEQLGFIIRDESCPNVGADGNGRRRILRKRFQKLCGLAGNVRTSRCTQNAV